MQMNKRGEISLRVIFIPVAIVLLFLLLYFGGGYIKEKGQALIYLIPGFGIEKKIPDDVKIIRYDIAKDSLSYYDGVKFIALDYKKDEAFGFDSGSKKVSSKYLRQRFIDKFYNGERPKLSELALGNLLDYGLVISSPNKPYYYREFQGGYIFDSIVNKDIIYGSVFAFNSQTKNAYILDIIDEIYFAVYSIKKSSGDSIVYESVTKIKEGSILYPSLIKWRDYVLTKPIEIEIEGGENVYVCVEKIGGFLSLDLDEGVDSEYECSNS